jgi:hypothetical protein
MYVDVLWDIHSENWGCGVVVTPSYSSVCGCLRSYKMPPGDRNLARTLFLREGFQRHILWLENGYSEDGSGIWSFVKGNKHFD